MAKHPKRATKTHAAHARERRLLAERAKHAATGPDQDKSSWASVMDSSMRIGRSSDRIINQEADDYIGIHPDAVMPCEVCGNTDTPNKEDRYALVKGRREIPVSPLDADAAIEDKRVARVCVNCIETDPEIKQALDYIDEDDLASINPSVLDRVHKELLKGLASAEGIKDFASRKVNEATKRRDALSDEILENEAEMEFLDNIQRDLQKLVERGQLTREQLAAPNTLKTIAMLAQARMEYGDITARPDLPELLAHIEAETDFCEPCNRLYPKGTHQHGAREQKMNGERVCDSAELLTINQLANFSAFEKTIPFEIMRKVDPTGAHLIGFRQHGSTTRGVKSRDYFRCQLLVKLRDRHKPYMGMVDIVPAWFVRLNEADESMLEDGIAQKIKFDLPPDTFSEDLAKRSGIDRLVRDATNYQDSTYQTYQNLPVEIISDEQMAKELQEADRQALERIAKDRGLENYRELGVFEAWAMLATHENQQVIEGRFKIALRACQIAEIDGGRQFTEADVEQAIKDWAQEF